MIFSKMNGCGNDYIFVYLPNQRINADYPRLAQALSNRNYSIGADGLVLIDIVNGTYYMRIFNADGSEADMCGNAIRCVAKYLYDNKYINEKVIDINTNSGLKRICIYDKNGALEYATVDMGIPKLIKTDNTPIVNYDIEDRSVTAVNIGNNHAVFFAERLDDLAIKTAQKISRNAMFKDGINVEIVKIIDKHNIEVRVWERGSGETLACGTGASASMYVAFIKGLVEDNVTVHLRGGDLQVSFNDGHIIMRGTAEFNFNGTINIDSVHQ